MSTKAKPSRRQSAVTLLACAGVAAGMSGSAWQPPRPAAPAEAALPAAVVAAPAPVALAPVQQPEAPTVAPATIAPTVASPDPAVTVAAATIQPAPTPDVAPVPVPEPVVTQAPAVTRTAVALPTDPATLRSRLHWLTVQVNGRLMRTPDPDSRLLLARSAAEHAGLAEVGLDFRDVYGVITAETSWVARTGMGRNGVASHGLAQLEPATARALGVRDANDPVEAVHGAAKLLKEAAAWSARRIAVLGLSGAERAARLREGISVYYNLSSRARERWNGLAHNLPVETRRHIFNVRAGIAQAERLQTGAGPSTESLLADAAAAGRLEMATPGPATRTVAPRRSAPAVPRPLGTISWSGRGGDAGAGGRNGGTHVVWSNGAVTRAGGRVQWSSRTPG